MYEWRPIESIKPGMLLARSVFDPLNRSFLIVQGMVLQDKHIMMMNNRGISKVCIDMAGDRKKRAKELYNQVLTATTSLLNKVREGREIFPEELKDTVDSLLSEIVDTEAALLALSKFYEYNEHLFAHSVNSAIFVAIIAKELGYSEEKTKKLIQGALLHDVGKCKVPKPIIEKKAKLTEEEMIQVKDHVIHGYLLLKKSGFSDEVIRIAYEHHERQDGSGYPRGLIEGEIHELARIMAAVDIYEALTSDRSHRKRILPHEAAEIIMAQSVSQLDQTIAKILLNKIAIYPVGMKVRLNNDEVGLVIAMDEDFPTRPMVQREDGVEYNLLNETTLFVKEIITELAPGEGV